jgi:hypothetical protein
MFIKADTNPRPVGEVLGLRSDMRCSHQWQQERLRMERRFNFHPAMFLLLPFEGVDKSASAACEVVEYLWRRVLLCRWRLQFPQIGNIRVLNGE